MKKNTPFQSVTTPVLDLHPSKYMNLLTDYGFKSVLKVQELAIDFLNDLLEGVPHIQKITYLDKESLGRDKNNRTAVFDLLCEDDQNREFIVEIQRISQKFFLDRSVFYASSRIRDNAPKGKEAFSNWDFYQKPLIFIGILDFDIKESLPDQFEHFLQLCDIRSKKVFYEKLSFIFLELPKFERMIGAELSADSANLNKWLFAFKKLHTLEKAPEYLGKGPFKRLLEIAEIANMTKKQKEDYELSLKQLADTYATNMTAREEGAAKAKIEIIKNFLSAGEFSVSSIAKAAAVEEDYVLALKNELEIKKQ